MENQQTSAELLKICAEIIETKVNYFKIAIENCNLNLAEFESVQAKFGEKVDNKNIFMPEGKENLLDELEGLKKNLVKWENTTPEEYAENILKSKERISDTKDCKIELLAITVPEEELEKLPKEEKELLVKTRENLEENLFYDAMWELGIDEEKADESKNHLKILGKMKELRVTLVSDIEEAIEHKNIIASKSIEEYAQDSLANSRSSLAYEVGLRRKHSLAEAMGVQSFVGLYRSNNSDVEPEMRLEDETITKIAELSEEEFRAMETELGRKRERFEKMAQRRVNVTHRGSRFINAQPRIFKVSIGASLASVAAMLGGAMMYDNSIAPEVSTVVLNAGGLGTYAGLAAMTTDIAALAVNGVVEGTTKKAGVAASKAVERYLKGLPIKEEVSEAENGELSSEE